MHVALSANGVKIWSERRTRDRACYRHLRRHYTDVSRPGTRVRPTKQRETSLRVLDAKLKVYIAEYAKPKTTRPVRDLSRIRQPALPGMPFRTLTYI